MGNCAIRPPVNRDAGGLTVTVGLMTVRAVGVVFARDVERDAVTADALTVVAVRVCLAGVLTVLTFRAGVPPPLDLVVTRDPLDELERPLELDELERPLELDELERPLERELREPPEPPAPADPEPERRANLATPQQKF
jgi:hypothetical protein